MMYILEPDHYDYHVCHDVVVVDLPLLRVAVEGRIPISLAKL